MITAPNIELYIDKNSSKLDSKLQNLLRDTYENIHGSHMISGEYQGLLLQMISQIVNPKTVLEIGTFTGFSALCLAKGLDKEGSLISLEKNSQLSTMHTKYLSDDKRIEVRYGNAIELIKDLAPASFDLIFIDADKLNYTSYYEASINLLRSGGLILLDNVLWRGRVAEVIKEDDNHALIINHLQELNKQIHQDERVEAIILPIRDGLSLIRKK